MAAFVQVQFGHQRPSKGECEQRIWSEEPQDLYVCSFVSGTPAGSLQSCVSRLPCGTYRRPSPGRDVVEVFPADPAVRPLGHRSVDVIRSGARGEQTRVFGRIVVVVVVWIVHAVSAACYGTYDSRRRRGSGHVVVRHAVYVALVSRPLCRGALVICRGCCSEVDVVTGGIRHTAWYVLVRWSVCCTRCVLGKARTLVASRHRADSSIL